MKRNLLLAVSLLVVVAMLLTGCAGKATPTSAPAATKASATTAPAAGKLKIAFIYIGAPGDLGWTYEHDRARKAVEQQFAGKIETTTQENVPENADAERILRQFAQQGYNMIFTTSFGYMDPTINVAKEFPNVKFEHCSGYKTADNVATYFGKIEQARYLAGMVAGKMTTSNIIGYVAAMPIPEVIRGCDAFTLGVRSVNPKATVRVVWTNTWYDPVKEREAAVALLDQGADIIAQHQDTTEPQKAAAERGKLSIGYDSDMAKFVGDTVLTGPVWNWAAYYSQTIQAALDGTWKSHEYLGGMKDNVVTLAPFSSKVPKDVQDLVNAQKDKILKGEWDVFTGPIKDQKGNIKVADGQKMADKDMLNINWFVEGVIGDIPASQ